MDQKIKKLSLENYGKVREITGRNGKLRDETENYGTKRENWKKCEKNTSCSSWEPLCGAQNLNKVYSDSVSEPHRGASKFFPTLEG